MRQLFRHLFKRYGRQQPASGQGLVEYALLLGLVALVVIAIIQLMGPAIEDVFTRLANRAPLAPPSLVSYTPPPSYTPRPTIDPAWTSTPVPSPTNTITPTNTIPPTATTTSTPTATATATCLGYGPYAIPGRVQIESFACGGSNVSFVDSTGDGGPGSGAYRQDVTAEGPDLAAISGGFYLGWLVPNEWVVYSVNAPSAGVYDLSFRVASASGNGRFRAEVLRNNQLVYSAPPVTVSSTGGNLTWSSVSVPQFPLLAGISQIRIVFENSGFNMDYFDVSGAAPTATPTCYTLTTTLSPTNGGSVSRSPAPNCGANSYWDGTVLTLSAAPNNNYTFNGWSGDASGTNSSASVTMSSNRNVTASFSQCFTVTTAVSPANSGAVNRSPAPNCGSQYIAGTTVTFSAAPAGGYTFGTWSGGVSGSSNPANLTINAAANVTANFNLIPMVTENFESNNWTGGAGWNGGWSNQSNATTTNSPTPLGSYHLRLQQTGRVQRIANLSGFSNASLTFYWKIVANNNGDNLIVEISNNNGSTWYELANINAPQNQAYTLQAAAIPPAYLTSTAILRIRSTGNNNDDYFYVDNITISSN